MQVRITAKVHDVRMCLWYFSGIIFLPDLLSKAQSTTCDWAAGIKQVLWSDHGTCFSVSQFQLLEFLLLYWLQLVFIALTSSGYGCLGYHIISYLTVLAKSIVGFQKWVLKSLGMPLDAYFYCSACCLGMEMGERVYKAGEWQVKLLIMHLTAQGATTHKQSPLSMLQIQDYMWRTDCMIT